MKNRCSWAGSDPLYIAYHDTEWGMPIHDDHRWFEFLLLEGAQAGLSWITILRKRHHYRKSFDNFNPKKIASYGDEQVKSLLANPGIIRNRLKIEAAIANASAFIEVQQEFGSFDDYIWRFVDGRPLRNRWKSVAEIPAKTRLSEVMSKELKGRGFKFVGPTICYAFMQATGLVNDHVIGCFRYKEV